MKPDRHKKEKNAIYKKKHGITDGSKQEHKINEQFRDTKVKDKTSGISDDSASKNLGHSDRTFPRCSEETEPDMPETNYRRRKVLSNWERYEVEEDTNPTVRGSDFAELLKSSASVFSHSQYRDELGLMKSEDSKQTTRSKFLTLDCDDLADSLMCIPLHNRLRIETSVFEPLMIQQCYELCKENASKYTRVVDQVESIVVPDYTSAETSNRNSEEHVTVKSSDPLVDLCSKASNELNTGTDEDYHLLINSSPKYVEESNSSSELDSECKNKVQNSTDVTLAATLRQPELEVGSKTPLSTLSASMVEDKMVAGSKCGTPQSLKELENELDLLLAL